MTSLSLGAASRSSSAVADTSMPGVHAPHWAAPWRTNDFCFTTWSGARAESPPTVVTSRPSICPAAIRQAQTGSPSTRTVQAPQSPASQPTLVPVSPRCSRSTLERRSTGETKALTLLPFTENTMEVGEAGWRGVVVAMSAAPHASIESALHQGQSSVVPVSRGGAYVIYGREQLEVL